MPFLTQGKTDWKFLLIVVVLAVIVGVFGWQWWAWKIAPDKYCEQVDDCIDVCGCGCINKDSICKLPLGIMISCESFECDCVDNQCVEKPIKTPIDRVADWKICSTNADCIIVDGDCCGCNSGGIATTINKDFKGKWEEKLLKECKEIDCPAVISDDPSCFKEPRCIDNTCQLVKDGTTGCKLEDIRESDKFEGSVLLDATEKTLTDKITLYLYFDHELNDNEINQIENLGIIIQKESWIPPVGMHPLGFYVVESKISDICKLINADLIKRVASGEGSFEPQD